MITFLYILLGIMLYFILGFISIFIYVLLYSTIKAGHFKLLYFIKFIIDGHLYSLNPDFPQHSNRFITFIDVTPINIFSIIIWPLFLLIAFLILPFWLTVITLNNWYQKNKDKEMFVRKNYKTKKILYGEKEK